MKWFWPYAGMLILYTMWQGLARGWVAPGFVMMQLWGIGKNLNWQPGCAKPTNSSTVKSTTAGNDILKI